MDCAKSSSVLVLGKVMKEIELVPRIGYTAAYTKQKQIEGS